MGYSYDPEFAKAFEPVAAAKAAAPKFPVHDVASRRAALEQMWSGLMDKWPVVSDVEETVFSFKSFDGVDIKLHRFIKTDASGSKSSRPTPAVVYTHGGGYFCLNVSLYRKKLHSYVTHSRVQFFAVEYRLAPEHPFPTPVEDCYAAVLWVMANSATLNIDTTRIAIMGDSAGGGLAAGVALLSRDRKLEPPLRKQVLINPMLDDRNQSRFEPLDSLAIWTPDDNLTGWGAYLGREVAGRLHTGVSIYGAPSRAPSVANLPPLYLDVPDLDIFRDESIEYVARHAAAAIPTEFHLYPGLPHSFESFAPDNFFAKVAWANRVRAIQDL